MELTGKPDKRSLPKALLGALAAEPYRAVLGGLFYLVLAVVYGLMVLREAYRPELPWITLAFAALAVVYLLLPWGRPVGKAGAAALLAFPLLLFWAGYLTNGSNLLFAALAHAVYLFGIRLGIAYAAALVGPIFVVHLADDGFDAGLALLETVDSGISLAIVVAVCAAAVRSGERQEKTRALLAELVSAHAELERRAAKVRELAVAEERARMAREVHDSVGHHLTVINLHLENARRLRERRPEGGLGAGGGGQTVHPRGPGGGTPLGAGAQTPSPGGEKRSGRPGRPGGLI